jgi:dihydrolipoamide dehydrogenase
MARHYQAVVIGAGPGGYACGIRLAQLKIKTLVIEKESLGGVCLNVGCIPSKAMIHAAKTYEKSGKSEAMGISAKPVLDFAKTQAWKQGVVAKMTGGIAQLLKGNGCDHLMGEARFLAPKKLAVKTAAGVEEIEADHIVIATGSSPIEIPGFKFDEKNVWSSTGALAATEVPKRLIVIGGGYIGLELGMAYAKFGSAVTIIEATAGLLPGQDPELVKAISLAVKKRGLKVFTEAKAKGFTAGKDGIIVEAEINGQMQKFDGDKVLVTVGRRPNSRGFDIEKSGVKLDERGFITVDKQRRTNVEHIFAIGDIAGQPMLAHKASAEAEIAAEVIAGHKAEYAPATIPAVIFTDPEIATAGMSEPEAKAAGFELQTGKFPFGASGRAVAINEAEGFVRVIADRKTGRVLGIQIVGPEASDLISEAALAIEMNAYLDDLAMTVHPHPTLGEAVMEAAKAALGAPVHVLPAK